MTHVAVIGGGYAGMAAAVTLAGKGLAVTVFEAARELGGRARRVDYRDTALDNGLHVLIGAYRETLRLIRLVNPAHAQALTRLSLEWNVHHEFHLSAPRLPAPLNLLAGLLRAHGLSVKERLSVIRFMGALTRDTRDRYAPELDTSVESLLKQYQQSEKLCRVLWRPLCVSALNTPPGIASARVFFNVLRDSLATTRDASDILIPRVDLSALFPRPAAAWLALHGCHALTAQRVTAIDQTDSGFSVEVGGRRLSFSHVICALPPHQVNAFLIGITALSELAASIAALDYQPIHSVWLQYPRSVMLPSLMLGFTGGLVQWAFDRERLCGQRGLIGVVMSAQGAHQNLTQDQLSLQVHQELKLHLGDLPEPLWHRVIAEKRATFSCTVGVSRPPQVTPLKNFYLAGDYTASEYPATIETAVRSGITCATHISSNR